MNAHYGKQREGKHGNRVESVYGVVNQSDLISNKNDILEKFGGLLGMASFILRLRCDQQPHGMELGMFL